MPAIRKILCPTDFSGFSNRAFEHALAWAGAFGADIHLLHVVTVHNFDPFNPELGFPETGVHEVLQRDAEAQLDRLLKKIPDPAPVVTRESRAGYSPWGEIIDCAREQEADLIVMATHGYRGLGRLFLGSTAARVLEHTPCPVLLLRPGDDEELPAPGEIGSLLLPTDFSAAADAAAPLAFDLARHFGSRITLLHCVEQEINPAYSAAGITSIFELNETILTVSRDRMAALVPGDFDPGRVDDFVVVEGQSSVEIAAYARTAGSDLIVMATHGYTGLERVLLGSTTDRTVRLSPCPVLVVRSAEQ